AAQESFIKVWKKINTSKSHYKFTTWLYKIVINTCLDRLRKKARHNAIFAPMNDQDDLYNAMLVSPKIEFEENQLVEFIRVIASKLSGKQHSVFVLHDLEELSQEEISKILNMSRGSVKSNLYHARKAIRKVLSSRGNKIITTSDGM
ncbi:MAG: RNA polymerase sigma factor, partial [Cyclobacteriaceae bacterium]|nr:RNA polymerase sigma factor [Cyclobacteriaceae bacterium]